MTSPDGYDRLAERMEARGERMAGNLADHPTRTVLKWVGIVLVCVVAISLVSGVIAYIGGYWDNAKQIVSAQNHKKQSYDVRENWNSLLTASQNACSAQAPNGAPADPNKDPVIVGGDPSMAYAQTYRNIRTNYNRAQDNPYENGVINAGGYPKHVPVFPEEFKNPIDWCSVQAKILDLHR